MNERRMRVSANRTFITVASGVTHRVAHRVGAGWASVILGVLATVIAASGSGVASLWGDEAASVMSAERPFVSLWPMLARVDAVHGVYYVLLHFWIELFGSSAFSVRFPSALAVGFATGGLVLLANRLGGLRLGVVAGLLFMIIPRTTYMGTEARSYALSAAIAVWLTLLLVILIRRAQPHHGRRARVITNLGWGLYALGLAFGISLFLYLAFLAVAHMIMVFLLRGARSTLRAWVIAGTAALLVIAPFVVEVIGQRQQVAFLATRPRVGIWQILVEQWMGNVGFALIAWGIIAFGLVAALRDKGRGPHRGVRSLPPIVLVGLSWLLIPQILMLLLTLVTPLYALRYLSFVTPALALLLGFAVVSLTRIRYRPRIGTTMATTVAAALVVALMAASVMTYLGQRTPYAKNNGTDFAEVSTTIGLVAVPGDAVMFDPSIRSSRLPRLAMHLYPDGFINVTDVLLSKPFATTSWLWDTQHPIKDAAQYIEGIDRIWVIEADHSSRWALNELEVLGFRVVQVIAENTCAIYELQRG